MIIKKIKETHNDNDYLSVNAFKNERRNEKNLMQFRSFYVDLDIIDTDFYNITVEKANAKYENCDSLEVVKLINDEVHNSYTEKITQICGENSIPNPSKINYTGGGYHVYWDLETLKEDSVRFKGASYVVKNVYKNIQKEVVNIFSSLGSDAACTDVSRLLRPEGSYNTKRDEITQTIILNNNKSLLVEFTNLLKYTYDEVIEYKKITEKQISFILDKKIKTNKSIKDLTKEEAIIVIATFIDGQKKATKKQIEVLEKYNHEFKENITVAQASELIKSSKPKTDYIYAILTRAYNNSDIKEGNRSLFIFYMAISHRRTGLDKDQSLTKLNNYNSKLKLNIEELKSINSSAYRDYIKTLNIKKETIIKQLKLDKKYLNKKINRSIKSKVEAAKHMLTKNFHKLESLSIRKLASEFNISKSTISKLKNEIKEYIKTTKKNNSSHYLNMLEELNAQVEVVLVMCPQNDNKEPQTVINTE